jgi:hypothetical protein
MTRLQRWCLAALLFEILALEALFVDVLRYFTPLHVARPAVIFFIGLAIFAVMGLVMEK